MMRKAMSEAAMTWAPFGFAPAVDEQALSSRQSWENLVCAGAKSGGPSWVLVDARQVWPDLAQRRAGGRCIS